MHKCEVIEKCNENLEKASHIIEKESINQIIKIMTKPLIARIKKIQNICSVEKYNLCFIGEVGVGKSTAITNLLGFIDENKLNAGNKLTEVPLFKTAEGRTTLCETEIYFSREKKTSIVIEEVGYFQFKEIVGDFCLKLLKKNDDSTNGTIECSNEVQRVIRNMSGFPTKDKEKQENYIRSILGSRFSEERELHELAKIAILDATQYQNRTKKEIVFSNDQDIEYWIKSTMFKINDGEFTDVPYPSKITLILNTNDLKVDIPNFVERIRDTRGIDGNAVREDINQLCSDINNICIICDNIKDYGNIVSEGFLKNQFIQQNKDLKYRNFVMGLEQGAQLSKANGADGRENGKDIKREEAFNNWNSICLDEHNMLFYNAFYGIKYESEEQEIISIDKQKYNNERISVIKSIETKFSVMYEEYSKELADINQKLSTFNKNAVEDCHKEKLVEISNIVFNCMKNLEGNFDLFFSRLEEEIRTKTSPGYIRGSVNRRGVYDNYNFYSQAKNVSYEEFDKTASSPLFFLEKECERLFAASEMMEEALQLAIKYKIRMHMITK